MPVAAIYDVHGNLPALEAVLEDVRQAGVDFVVVGGDVLPGPMPVETLDCLQRHTAYDLARAAARIGATSYPQATEFASGNVLSPPSEERMLEVFARAQP